jgi:hypothetical protein
MMPKKAGTARKLVFRFQIMELNSCKAGMVCCVMANRGRKLGAARKVPCNTLIFQRDLGVPKPRCFAGALLKRIKIGYQILGGPRAKPRCFAGALLKPKCRTLGFGAFMSKPRCFAGALLKRDGLGGVGDLVAEAKPRCFAGALLKPARAVRRRPAACPQPQSFAGVFVERGFRITVELQVGWRDYRISNDDRFAFDFVERLAQALHRRPDRIGRSQFQDKHMVFPLADDAFDRYAQFGVAASAEPGPEYRKLKPFAIAFHQPENPAPALRIGDVVADDVERFVRHASNGSVSVV